MHAIQYLLLHLFMQHFGRMLAVVGGDCYDRESGVIGLDDGCVLLFTTLTPVDAANIDDDCTCSQYSNLHIWHYYITNTIENNQFTICLSYFNEYLLFRLVFD